RRPDRTGHLWAPGPSEEAEGMRGKDIATGHVLSVFDELGLLQPDLLQSFTLGGKGLGLSVEIGESGVVVGRLRHQLMQLAFSLADAVHAPLDTLHLLLGRTTLGRRHGGPWADRTVGGGLGSGHRDGSPPGDLGTAAQVLVDATGYAH